MSVTVKFKTTTDTAAQPQYADDGSAAMDLRADIRTPFTLGPGSDCKIPTGLSFEIPPGYVGKIYARSGNAAKHRITLTNSVGIIDSSYRGEVLLLLTNFGNEPYVIQPGERMAQIMFLPVPKVILEPCDSFSETIRGSGGFGSSGKMELVTKESAESVQLLADAGVTLTQAEAKEVFGLKDRE